MADVIHRTTLEFRGSVHTPDFPEPTWKHNPNMTGVVGVPSIYWKAPPTWIGDVGPVEMTQGEKDAVDAAEAAALVTANRAVAVAAPDDTQEPIGWETRALIELLNKRDNYLTNRIEEVQEDLQAIKASSGPADNIRNAVRNNYLATATRARADAVQDYKDDINAGGADS